MQKKTGSKPKFFQKKWFVKGINFSFSQNKIFLMYRYIDLFFHSSYLCDVTLKSDDGKEFPCHKSVLCARLGKKQTN